MSAELRIKKLQRYVSERFNKGWDILTFVEKECHAFLDSGSNIIYFDGIEKKVFPDKNTLLRQLENKERCDVPHSKELIYLIGGVDYFLNLRNNSN